MTTIETSIDLYVRPLWGHVKLKYNGLEATGNVLMQIADLQQIAALRLIRLTRKWEDVAAEYWPGQPAHQEGFDPRFWSVLLKDVDYQIRAFARRGGAGGPDGPSFNEDAEDEASNEADKRTSLHAGPDRAHWAVIHDAVTDFWDTMPKYDKTILALRYFDALSPKEIAALVDVPLTRVYDHIATARTRWRTHARNQFTDHLESVAPRHPNPWEPPHALNAWLIEHGWPELPDYLGFVTRCFRDDIGYPANVLTLASVSTGRPQPERRVLSPFQGAQVDKWLTAGMSMMQIARDLGVAYHAVTGYVAAGRRAA